MERLTRRDVVFHLAAQVVSSLHVLLLDLVLIGSIDQILEHLDGVLGGRRHVHILHLEAEVALRDKSVGAKVDLGDQVVVNDNAKLLSFLVQVLKFLDALANGLVVVHVLDTGDEAIDLQLFLELEVEHLCSVVEFDVDIGLVGPDLVEHLVESVVVVARHRVPQVVLGQVDEVVALVATANRPLGSLAVFLFEDHRLARAARAVEITAILAVELDVSEVEF